MTMRIGMFSRMALSIGADGYGPASIDELVAEATVVEADGLATYWLPNQFDLHAPLVVAHLAGRVPRIELGAAVLPIWTRHPLLTAQEALTADLIADGRFTLGLGVEHRFIVEHVFGLTYDHPVDRLREYLHIVKSIVRQGTSEHRGTFYSTNVELARVRPAPDLPILLGALGPRMLRLAAEDADGTITWMCGPRTLGEHVVPTITAAAQAAGRPRPRVVAVLPVAVTARPIDVRECIGLAMSPYGLLPSYRAMLDREREHEGNAEPGDIGIVGGHDEVLESVHSLAAAGVTDLAVLPFHRNEAEHEALRETLRVATQQLSSSADALVLGSS